MLTTRPRMILASVLLSALAAGPALVSGCLTPEQAAAVAQLQTASDSAGAHAQELLPQIAAVSQAIAEGKLPAAEGTALVNRLLAQREDWVKVQAQAGDAIVTARAAGTPWWSIALAGVSGLAAVVGAVFGIPIAGKLGQATAAVGVLSRSADAAGLVIGLPPGEAPPAFKASVLDELTAKDAEITAEVLKALHAQARAGTI